MTLNRPQLFAGAAVGLVLAVGLGFGLARMTAPKPATEAASRSAEAKAPVADEVKLDAAAIRAAGIAVEPASSGGLNAEILAQATVAAAPDGQAVLTARAAGAVTRISKRLGDPVRAGETVAVVESRDAAAIAAERASAAAKAALARTVLAREQRLYEQRVSPRQDLEQAQAEAAAANAEARRAAVAAGAAHVSADGRSVLVTSPISGRVTSVSASLGSFVQSETELFRVTDPARIQVEAAVTSVDAARIAPGDPAVIQTAAGQPLTAAVRAVTPAVSQETRAATVVLAPAGGANPLQPGQLVSVRIRPRLGANSGGAIVVADEAVQTVDGRDSVFVRTPTGFRARAVTVGQRGGGRAEIVAGLKPGEAIATKNAFLLKAELGKSTEEE